MKIYLEKIFEFEDTGNFEEALSRYNCIYKDECKNYTIWKHFYFFLWISLEDATNEFCEKNNIRLKMQTLLKDGEENFYEIADFNFIAGYTISLFPYEFGEYEKMRKKASSLLVKATHLAPSNPIYKMFLLGSEGNVNSYKMKEARINAYNEMIKSYKGRGFLNRYFLSYLNIQ